MQPVTYQKPPSAPSADLEALFREQGTAVFHAAFRVTGNAADAEDALQTVFLRLAQRPDLASAIEQGGAAYMRRSAVNAGLDVLRARGRSRSVALDDDSTPPISDPEAGPERRQQSREAQALLRRALTRISPRAAEIFALRYFEGYGNREIARLLDCTQTAVAVTLHRTRARLKDELGPALGGL